MKTVVLTVLFAVVSLNALSEDLAYKQMPIIAGRPVGTIYLERGPTTGCPERPPVSDSTNFWAGGRLTQGDINIKVCWFRNDRIITILQPEDGNQIKIAAAEFTYLPHKPVTSSPVAPAPSLTKEKSDENAMRNSFCTTYGAMFKTIAAYRDNGISPELTLKGIKAFETVIPIASQKRAINLVYFDHAFENVRGTPLASQIIQTCLFGPSKPFEPLK